MPVCLHPVPNCPKSAISVFGSAITFGMGKPLPAARRCRSPVRDRGLSLKARANVAHGRSIRTARGSISEWVPLEGDGLEVNCTILESNPKEYGNPAGSAATGEIRSSLAVEHRTGWKGRFQSEA